MSFLRGPNCCTSRILSGTGHDWTVAFCFFRPGLEWHEWRPSKPAFAMRVPSVPRAALAQSLSSPPDP